MTGIIRQSLVVAAISVAATYSVGKSEELSRDASAIIEMAQSLPEPNELLAQAKRKHRETSRSVRKVKRRLDLAKRRIEDGFAISEKWIAAAN